MNQLFKEEYINKNGYYQNMKNQIEQQKNNFRQLKEYYKTKSNLDNYLQKQKCSQFLENFELIDYISSGSSGVVYEGCHRKKPENRVCLKFLLNKSDLERRDKIFNKNNNNNLDKIKKDKNNKNDSKIDEINIQKILHHKNIAKYYDYCDLKEYGCIVMELAHYGDLDLIQKKSLQRKYLSETFLAYITKQILDGLYFIHKSKIIHMDIKQQNILIDKNLEVKITDFSVSLSYEKVKATEKIKLPLSGTNPYMCPEVLGQEQIDIEDASKIDTYSLGVMLYYLSFGEFPYNLNINLKKNFSMILQKIKDSNLEMPENKINCNKYSYLYKKFLKNLLDKNIKNRLSVFEAMDDPWIKGAQFIFKEKEKIGDMGKFLLNLNLDNIGSFNEYLKNNNSKTFNTSN